SRIVPPSRGCTPVNTLINVLLPAPFSPMSAWTSPARTVKSTPCSAFTPGKVLARPRISSSAFGSVAMSVGKTLSILAIGKFRRGLRHFEDALFDFRALGQLLLRHDGLDGVEQLRANERIAFNRAIQFAGRHRLERAAHAV